MITIAKIIKKERINYIVPVRYSSTTCYRVFDGDNIVYDGLDVFNKRLSKKEVIKWVSNNFNDSEIIFKDFGSVYV